MNIKKLALLGTAALMTTLAMGMAHAGDCKILPNDSVGFVVEHSDGTVIDGNKCVAAIVAGVNAFDKNIDKVINNKIVSAAFDSMNKDAKTMPEAQELQTTYRTERAAFVNDFLKSSGLDSLPTKGDGKRYASDAKEKMDDYLITKEPFSPDKVKEIRSKFTQQAKAYVMKKDF